MKKISLFIVFCLLISQCTFVAMASNESYTPNINGTLSGNTLTLSVSLPEGEMVGVGFKLTIKNGGTASFTPPTSMISMFTYDDDSGTYSQVGYGESEVSSNTFAFLFMAADTLSLTLSNNQSSGVVAEISPLPSDAANMIPGFPQQTDDLWALAMSGGNMQYWYAGDSTASVTGGGVELAGSGSSTPDTSSYSAYLSTDATEIAPGGTYIADLYMKSDDALSAGEIDLAAANGKITNIALADGIGMTQVDDVSDGKTEAKISFDGNTVSAKEGLKIATITVQATDSLTDGSSVELNISNAVAAKTGSTKDQTVTLGEDAKVAVPVITAANCSCESYAAGKYLVKYTGTVADGEVAKYGEEEMFWSPKYASWVYLTNSDVSQTLRDSRFSSVSGTKKDLTCTGDVNGNSVVNIVDAQVAYDIANSVYSDFTNPTMEQWLMADVNADSMVDASDARAIQCIVHGLTG